jgi:hypothetical protein
MEFIYLCVLHTDLFLMCVWLTARLTPVEGLHLQVGIGSLYPAASRNRSCGYLSFPLCSFVLTVSVDHLLHISPELLCYPSGTLLCIVVGSDNFQCGQLLWAGWWRPEGARRSMQHIGREGNPGVPAQHQSVLQAVIFVNMWEVPFYPMGQLPQKDVVH